MKVGVPAFPNRSIVYPSRTVRLNMFTFGHFSVCCWPLSFTTFIASILLPLSRAKSRSLIALTKHSMPYLPKESYANNGRGRCKAFTVNKRH